MEFTSLNALLESSFKENWDRPALSDYQGAGMTYGELAGRIARLHMLFYHAGLKPGDKVALCGRNQSNWGVCFLAAVTYGAVAVPILHEFKPGNIHYLVNHSEARMFFVGDVIWESISEAEMPALEVIVQISNLQFLYAGGADVEQKGRELDKAFEEKYPAGFGPQDISYWNDSPEELALINYTSGTSGFSKGVMLPYRALLANIRFAFETAEPQMNCESEVVALLPSAHMYGLMFEFLFEITCGAHVHFLTRVPSPKIIVKAFKEVRPDIIVSVPLIIEKMYKSVIKPQVDRNKLFLSLPIVDQMVLKKVRDAMIDAFGVKFEEVILGGAAFNPEVEAFLRRIHFPFTVGYGMTECGPIITYSKWYRTKKGSCGTPVPGCFVRIDSPQPSQVPGEVQIKGDNVFSGYYKNEAATAEAFTEDGWFRTGDMGVVDEEGYLYLRGRLKCMILGPSGQNIYPEEIEAVINNVNYVVDSLVVEDGGHLTALIYPDHRQGEADGLPRQALEKRILSSLPEINKSLPNYAQIHKIEFMPEDFERTPKKNIKRYLYQR